MSVWEDIKSAWKKVAYVFTPEYKDRVRHYAFLEQNADIIKLKDNGTDMDEVIRRLQEKGIEPKFHIDLNWKEKSPHQDFVSKLNPKQSISDVDSKIDYTPSGENNTLGRIENRQFERDSH